MTQTHTHHQATTRLPPIGTHDAHLAATQPPGVITTKGVMTTWLMVAASAHLALVVVEHQPGAARARELLGPLLLPRLMPNSEALGAPATSPHDFHCRKCAALLSFHQSF